MLGWCCIVGLLYGFFRRRLCPILIIQDHLLEAASPRAPRRACTLRPWNLTSGARCRAATLRSRATTRCRAALAPSGPAAAGEPSPATRKLPGAPSAPRLSLPLSLSLSLSLCVVVTGRRAACRGIGGGTCGRPTGSWSGVRILRCRRRTFDALQRGNRERQIDRSRCSAQVQLFAGVIKTKLRDFDSVVARGKSRQIEMTIFVGPAHPGAPGRSFHQTQIRTGNGHAPRSVNGARGVCGRRRLRRLWLLLCAQRKRWQSEKQQRKEAKPYRDLS